MPPGRGNLSDLPELLPLLKGRMVTLNFTDALVEAVASGPAVG